MPIDADKTALLKQMIRGNNYPSPNSLRSIKAPDLTILSRSYDRLQQFRISLCQALYSNTLKRCYRRDRAFKRYKTGIDHLEKHMDIVRLIKMSMGFETLIKV